MSSSLLQCLKAARHLRLSQGLEDTGQGEAPETAIHDRQYPETSSNPFQRQNLTLGCWRCLSASNPLT